MTPFSKGNAEGKNNHRVSMPMNPWPEIWKKGVQGMRGAEYASCSRGMPVCSYRLPFYSFTLSQRMQFSVRRMAIASCHLPSLAVVLFWVNCLSVKGSVLLLCLDPNKLCRVPHTQTPSFPPADHSITPHTHARLRQTTRSRNK